ncbi:hypothetical protein AAF712_013894 [Marasmius tenuissimus]|uniref:Uncharacterized protein n=1 Tax=Marasmius tenuissimus TaxID=585030 RepID=A0ABR2ZCG7_9AGAR
MIQSSSDNSHTGLLELLFEHNQRWQYVDFHHLDGAVNLEITKNGPFELPWLQELVYIRNNSFLPTTCLFEDCMKSSTLLAKVTVRYDEYVWVPAHPWQFGMPVKHLTFQYGPDGSYEESLDVLKEFATSIETLHYESTPDATQFDYTCSADHSPFDEVPDDVVCKHVSELGVNLYNEEGIFPHLSDIFQTITLPSLKSLSLIGDCEFEGSFSGAWPHHYFDHFLARSRCSLRELTLDGLPISDVHIIGALNSMPLLESLTITELFAHNDSIEEEDIQGFKSISKDLVARLSLNRLEPGPTPSSTVILPRLNHLAFCVLGHFDADTEFVSMIKSRWYPASASSTVTPTFQHQSLKIATLHVLGRRIDESVYEPLEDLDGEGMQIVVKARGCVVI